MQYIINFVRSSYHSTFIRFSLSLLFFLSTNIGVFGDISPGWGLPVHHGKELSERNTGVPEGQSLIDIRSSITVTEAWIKNTNGGLRVIESINFLSGANLFIEVDGFTVLYCKFNGQSGLRAIKGRGKNVAILYCEFDGKNENHGGDAAIDGAKMTLKRLHIHNWPRTIMVGDSILVEECYMHDLTCDNSGAHIENIYVAGGTNQAYIRNKLISNASSIGDGTGQISASLAIYNESWGPFPDLKDIRIEDNYFESDGGYALYVGACVGKLPKPYASQVIVSGNIFGRSKHRNSGIFGPATAFDRDNPNNEWKNNTWGPRGPDWQSADPEEGDMVQAPGPS